MADQTFDERHRAQIDRDASRHVRREFAGYILMFAIAVVIIGTIVWTLYRQGETQVIGRWVAGDRVVEIGPLDATGTGPIRIEGRTLRYSFRELHTQLVVSQDDGQIVYHLSVRVDGDRLTIADARTRALRYELYRAQPSRSDTSRSTQ